jgi:hypothetical protein
MYNQNEKQAGQQLVASGGAVVPLSAQQDYYERLKGTLLAVSAELLSARSKYPPFPTEHHGYGVLKEEVDEMWDEIKANNIPAAREEAVQVAAMAISFIIDMEGR